MAAAEKVRRWNQGTLIHEGGLDNAAQVNPAGGGGSSFILLQQAQAGTNALGLIVEPSTVINCGPSAVKGPPMRMQYFHPSPKR